MVSDNGEVGYVGRGFLDGRDEGKLAVVVDAARDRKWNVANVPSHVLHGLPNLLGDVQGCAQEVCVDGRTDVGKFAEVATYDWDPSCEHEAQQDLAGGVLHIHQVERLLVQGTVVRKGKDREILLLQGV